MGRDEIYAPIVTQLDELQHRMYRVLRSEEAVVQGVNNQLLASTGKRVRPALFLLSLGLWLEDPEPHIPVALAIEIIHAATLVHDDVVDNSLLRRSRPTVNADFGNHIAVLSGDYLFASAFDILSEYGNIAIIREMATVVKEMSEGEIQQQAEKYQVHLGEHTYLKRIAQKTAVFFAACSASGGIVAGASGEYISFLRSYGYKIGMAFQVIDDLLDFHHEQVTGKTSCGDLQQGIYTLPVIHMLRVSPHAGKLQKALSLKNINDDLIASLKREMKECHSMEYAKSIAEKYIKEALNLTVNLPNRPFRKKLEQLAYFILEREQ